MPILRPDPEFSEADLLGRKREWEATPVANQATTRRIIGDKLRLAYPLVILVIRPPGSSLAIVFRPPWIDFLRWPTKLPAACQKPLYYRDEPASANRSAPL